MSAEAPLVRNASDSARRVAAFRACETERPDPPCRDPFARRLAGERGERIAEGQFNEPGDVGVDPAGNIYVADTNNHRIQRFSPAHGDPGR